MLDIDGSKERFNVKNTNTAGALIDLEALHLRLSLTRKLHVTQLPILINNCRLRRTDNLVDYTFNTTSCSHTSRNGAR